MDSIKVNHLIMDHGSFKYGSIKMNHCIMVPKMDLRMDVNLLFDYES